MELGVWVGVDVGFGLWVMLEVKSRRLVGWWWGGDGWGVGMEVWWL